VTRLAAPVVGLVGTAGLVEHEAARAFVARLAGQQTGSADQSDVAGLGVRGDDDGRRNLAVSRLRADTLRRLGACFCTNCRPIGGRAQLLAENRLPLLAGSTLDPGAVPCWNPARCGLQPVVDMSCSDVRTGRSGDCRLATEDSDRHLEGVLGGHLELRISKHVCSLGANQIASKGCKILCVTKTITSLGELVQKWRVDAKFDTTTALADAINKKFGKTVVSRQNLDNLEKGDVGQPRYLPHLAQFMRTSVDDLLALRMPPLPNEPLPPPKLVPKMERPPSKFQARLDGMPADMRAAFEQAMLNVIDALRPNDRRNDDETAADWAEAKRRDERSSRPTRKRQPARKTRAG
jgi:hypothetical protein